MIGYLKGKVLNISLESALILVGGVGYEVYCSGAAFSKMTEGGECELYTYLQVSEQNGITLYGFADRKEKAMFLKLISISGVGPKMGLAVLTHMSVDDFIKAVSTGDTKRLSQVKGLGKKTAERIILELKDGLSMPVSDVAAGSAPAADRGSGYEDAVVALISLGFSRSESERAVARASSMGAKSVEDIIMTALKGM